MSLRSLTLCVLLGLAACSGADEGGAANDDAGFLRDGSTLAFQTENATLLPNREVDLVVLYRDVDGVPVAGVQVDFALVGAAPGASLSPARVDTDENGLARTRLRAGSTATDLDVRARAGEGAFDYIKVPVRPALGTTLEVGVRYAGTRDIASYTVTSMPMTCEEALSSKRAGDVSYTFSAPDETARFDLGYGVTAAIVGWGRDATGAKLVRGCTDFVAPITADVAEAAKLILLELRDIDLSLVASLSFELEVNVSAPARQFASASERAVASLVSPGNTYSMFADADYLLDAVANALTTAGDIGAVGTLAARRVGSTLAASLQPALAAAEVGPSAYGAQTGEQLAQRGASIVLRGVLSSALAAQLQSFHALSADGSEAVLFANPPSVEIEVQYRDDDAQLAFNKLRFALGLGAYGRSVWSGLDTAARAELARRAGCAEFASWWTKSELLDVTSAEVAQQACTATLTKLDAAIDAELSTLDQGRAALELGGRAQVHDRSDDGQVDDIGPSALAGSWGADAIQAELRVPSRTAFQ